MNKHLALALGLLLIGGALAGCGKSSSVSQPSGSSNGTAVEQAKVSATLAADLGVVNEDVFQSDTPMDMGGTLEAGGALAAIRPYRWWRHIDSVDRTFTTDFSDPDSLGRPRRAIVTVHKTFLGTFNVIAGDTAVGDTSRRLVTKPLEDRWVRKIALIRVPSDTAAADSMHREWRIVGTSGVEVTSANATANIQSVRIQAGALDTTITDPLALHRLRRVVVIPPHTPVNLTVTPADPTNVVVFYRWNGRERCHRNSNGSSTINWITSDEPGLRHFGVNALTAGTLQDDTAAYDSNAWILPFAVRGPDGDIEHRR